MKDRIRQILRQFMSTPEYNNPNLLKALYQFMNHKIKGYFWYTDTPEDRFGNRPESIWLINPKTKEWVLMLEKNGKLWWSHNFYFNFKRYFNFSEYYFEKFLKIWVEDVLNRKVSGIIDLSNDIPLFDYDVYEALKIGKELE